MAMFSFYSLNWVVTMAKPATTREFICKVTANAFICFHGTAFTILYRLAGSPDNVLFSNNQSLANDRSLNVAATMPLEI